VKLAWDIETIKNDRAKDYYLQKSYKAPSNYKDDAKKDAFIQAARQKDIDKAALYWWTGQIICITAIEIETGKDHTFSGPNERDVLSGFFGLLNGYVYRDPTGKNYDETINVTLIGKSSELFDRPYTIGRAMYQNIGLPRCLQDKRPITDVNHMFSRSSACQQVGRLSDYAWGLNIDGKLSHGSEVQEMYDNDDWDAINKYCLQDSAIVAEMVRRYTKEFKA